MKLGYFLLVPVALLYTLSAFSQQKDSLPDYKIDFRKVNQRQWAGFKPEKAEKGENAKERSFFSRFFGGRGWGSRGYEGLRGPDLRVEITALPSGDSTILQFLVTPADNRIKTVTYFVNPRYGRIKIVSDGGDGGDGGDGNNGKMKGSYKNKCGGDGGDGGRGGDAGYITVYIDESAVEFANSRFMTFSNYGGSGGKGGKGGKSRTSKGYKKDKPPLHDGENGENGPVGNSSNRVVMVGPGGRMLGWR